MSAANGTEQYITRAEFLREQGELAQEVGEVRGMIGNFLADQRRFLANQELRDHELHRKIDVLSAAQRATEKDLRDSVNDLEGEAMRAEMARKDSLIKALREDKKETRGWVVWAVRVALVGGGGFAIKIIEQLFFR